jgi:TolB-like protein/tetratricopeptide (TPR) repeat protein
LFGAGDPENKQFWLESGSVLLGLQDSFVRVGPGSLVEPARSVTAVSPTPQPEAGREGPSIPRIAVLPFANISPDPNDDYFADGLTEEMITVLSQLQGLRVIARTSVMPYKSTPKGVSQIGVELGVSAVLEGSVRKSGNDLRITVQLIDVGTQEHAWATSYDRKLENVFALQTEIARRVAKALEVKLRPSEEARLESRPSVRPESYLAYLKGRALLHEWSKASIEGARKKFELAISLDAKNAAAHAGLADALRFRGWWEENGPGAAWDKESRRLVARANQLDPNLSEAHASLGLMHYDDWNWTAAERELKLAVSLNPSYSWAHLWLGNLFEDLGRADEALAEYTLAEQADPLSAMNLFLLARLLAWLGRPDEALVKVHKLGEIAPNTGEYHLSLGWYHESRSDYSNYLKENLRAEEFEEDPGQDPITRAFLHAVAGEREQARAILGRLESAPVEPRFIWQLARIYAELGDLDGCFRWLEMGVSRHALSLGNFRFNPRLARVREDPRFQTLLKKMNLA